MKKYYHHSQFDIYSNEEIFNDGIVRCTIRHGIKNNEDYFASHVFIDDGKSNIGYYQKFKGKSSYKEEVERMKKYIIENYPKHLSKMDLFNEKKRIVQLSLFD